MMIKHILSAGQFRTISMLDHIFQAADRMEYGDLNGFLPQTLSGKILASLFYEPSTRTRFSFETAIAKLGGNIITTESAGHFSSVTKGETLEDTIRIISGYADVVVLRHHIKGAADIAAQVSNVPIINAGDGSGEHPTQALLDIYTLKKELGEIDGKTIALAGDLLYGRTIHSLLRFLTLYKKSKIYLVSPGRLRLPPELIAYLRNEGTQFSEVEDLHTIVEEIDALYITRIQKERFPDIAEYEKYKDIYVVDTQVVDRMKSHAVVLHPLPRVSEISPDVDHSPKAAYFRQAKNGLYIRMGLLHLMFNDDEVNWMTTHSLFSALELNS